VVSGQRYSPTTIDHFQHPRNVGRMADPDGIGRIDDAARETLVMLFIKIANGRISQATFRTFGCSACVAASSMATELLIGRAFSSALDADAIDVALGGLPIEKRYCAELVAEAARRAVAAAASGLLDG
jgi:nitrogen fixation NifU-like protein